MDYLVQLIQEKSTITAFPNYFKHVDRLIELGLLVSDFKNLI